MRHVLVLAGACAGGVLCAPSLAHAYDVLAEGCAVEPLYCKIAPIAFARKDTLPIEWSFDTGWIPSGSPLQVHLYAGVYANTWVELAGQLETSWPDTLTLRAPGKREGGAIGYHYGLEVGAQASVTITVLGQSFNWTGDIPYIPQIDFQVEGAQIFDAWGWSPGGTVASQTQTVTLAQVGIADIIGGSIPGIDGGFELDAAMELAATWTNHAIAIRTTDGAPVTGGPIVIEDGATTSDYPGGPSIEFDVNPEGVVSYDGTVHLIPAFYVELLGQSWSIPIADIPISFPITDLDWSFDAERVHVPLPDVVVQVQELDFGEVTVGEERYGGYPIGNVGEAEAEVAIGVTDPENFPLWDESLWLDPGVDLEGALRFAPKSEGHFEAELYLTSNDPDAPQQVIILKGEGIPGPVPPGAPAGPESPEASSGCGCSVPGATSQGELGLALAGLGLGAVALRRRRRPAR
ncbi:MAG: hypothetical protein HY908_22105 [Myxococcales bacterium]|nr:hypothetical protein [Myxococcales bacterium]